MDSRAIKCKMNNSFFSLVTLQIPEIGLFESKSVLTMALWQRSFEGFKKLEQE